MSSWARDVNLYFLSEPCASYLEGVCRTAIQLNEETLQEKPCIGSSGAIAVLVVSDQDVLLAHKTLSRYAKHWNGVISIADRYPELLITKYRLDFRRHVNLAQWQSSRRKEIRVINVQLLDAHVSDRSPSAGVSAVVDPGLSVKPLCHPYFPFTIQEGCVVPSTKREIFSRAKHLLQGRRSKSAYFLMMTEHAFKTRLRDEGRGTVGRSLQDCASQEALVKWIALNSRNSNETTIAYPLLEKSLECLFMSGLIDEDGNKIDPVYSRVLSWLDVLADLPLAVMMTRSAERSFGCVMECAAICAMLQKCPSPFLDRKGTKDTKARERLARMTYAVKEGDMISLLNIFQAAANRFNEPRWFDEHLLKRQELYEAKTYGTYLLGEYRRIHGNEFDEIPSCGSTMESVLKVVAVALCHTLVFRQHRAATTYVPWREFKYRDIAASKSIEWSFSRDIVFHVSGSSCYQLGSLEDWPDTAVGWTAKTLSTEELQLQFISPARLSWLETTLPHAFSRGR